MPPICVAVIAPTCPALNDSIDVMLNSPIWVTRNSPTLVVVSPDTCVVVIWATSAVGSTCNCEAVRLPICPEPEPASGSPRSA